MLFIENLLNIMETKDITAYKLCKDTGITMSNITRWKSGTLPTIDKIIILVEYLQVSSDDLLGINKKEIDNEYTELVKQYKLHDESIRASVRKLLDMQQTTEGESYNSKIG